MFEVPWTFCYGHLPVYQISHLVAAGQDLLIDTV